MEFPMTKITLIAIAASLTLLSVSPAALQAEASQSVRDAAAETAPAAPVNVVAGKALYGANGSRIASVYRVSADGRVQIILDGKLITVPSSTLSEVDGKVTTSLTKSELARSAR
jgi:hypothetical protein